MLDTNVAEIISVDDLMIAGKDRKDTFVPQSLLSASEVNTLLLEHLNVVIDTTEKASLTIINRVMRVDEEISGLTSRLTEAVNSCEQVRDEAMNTIASLQTSRDEMAAYIKNKEAAAGDYEKNMAAILDQTRHLSALTDEMKRMSVQGACLSLNATAQAAHAGAEGAGFRVVAGEVRNMADRFKKMSESIDNSIVQVVERAVGDKSNMIDQSVIESDVKRLASFSERLESIIQLFQRYDTMNSHAFASISDAARQAGDSMMDMMAGIQFQDITRQQLEVVKHTLTHVNGHFDALLEAWDDEHAFAALDALNAHDMFSQYVMEDQRRVHQEVISEVEMECSDIDFF